MADDQTEARHDFGTIHAKLLSITGTCTMRDVDPLDGIVESLSKPQGSPVEMSRPPLIPSNTRFSSRLVVQIQD